MCDHAWRCAGYDDARGQRRARRGRPRVDQQAGDDARTHAQRLPSEITAIAAAHGVALADVDRCAVASGRGSFTGLRIGIATIQGLAFVQGQQVVAVPALEAPAHASGATLMPGTVIAAWMDAHRREVFAAAYRATSEAPFTRGRFVDAEEPTAGDPGSILARGRERFAALPPAGVGDARCGTRTPSRRRFPAR